jgi:hypothetical protein
MTIVRRRCVFYVSGFDPAGAARYHALYATEAARQAALGTIALQVGPRVRQQARDSSWEIDAVEGGEAVHTRYEFLQWDDIVRQHWTRSRVRLSRDLVQASLHVLRSGAARTMWGAHRTAALVVLLPFVLMTTLVFGTPLAAAAAALVVCAFGGGTLAALAGAALAAALLVRELLRRSVAYSADWIARSLAFTVRQARGEVSELPLLLERHAQRIAARLAQGDDDEVLVVGHSSGSILAVAIVARVLAHLPVAAPASRPVFSLLTLGQCIPVLGALPEAGAFRDELRAVGTSPRVDWIDFSAAPDACCFPLVDPLAACGVRSAVGGATGPRLLSPRFFQMFEPAEYAARRRDKFSLHFQYLKAGQRAVDYDYFRITAGARTLAARYESADCAAA